MPEENPEKPKTENRETVEIAKRIDAMQAQIEKMRDDGKSASDARLKKIEDEIAKLVNSIPTPRKSLIEEALE